jgi:hypothetical protein
MLSKLVSQVVVFGTPLIMVCLFIAFIGLFIYFNRRIDRVVDRVNTLSELVSVLQDIVNTRPSVKSEPVQAPIAQQESEPVAPTQVEQNKVIHVAQSAGEKIVVSDDEDDYVSSSEEGDEEEDINLMIEDEEPVEDEEPLITVTKMEHSPEPETQTVPQCDDDVCEIKSAPAVIEVDETEPCLIDDDIVSVVSMSAPTVIPEPILEEICTNAVLKEKFLSTNYRGYKVNQLRDLATELHLIKDKDAAKLKKGELLTFLDKTYVGLKN